MQLLYCPSCRHVSLRSRLERRRCETCNGEAHLVRVPYPWQYYAGLVLVFGGALFLVLPQAVAGLAWEPLVATPEIRVAWLAGFIVAGLIFTNAAVRAMKATARRRGLEEFGEAEA